MFAAPPGAVISNTAALDYVLAGDAEVADALVRLKAAEAAEDGEAGQDADAGEAATQAAAPEEGPDPSLAPPVVAVARSRGLSWERASDFQATAGRVSALG